MNGLLKIVLGVSAVLAASASAQARSMVLTGTAGYLSEWQLAASVDPASASDGDLLAGPLTVTHVGLCSPNGAVEKKGEAKLRISRATAPARVLVMLSFDGVSCTYDAPLSAQLAGSMDCSDAKGVPLQMTLK